MPDQVITKLSNTPQRFLIIKGRTALAATRQQLDAAHQQQQQQLQSIK